MWNVANAKRADGDVDTAVAIFTECAELSRRRGLSVGQMVACNSLGEIWDERADLDESRRFGVSCCYEPRTNIAWTT